MARLGRSGRWNGKILKVGDKVRVVDDFASYPYRGDHIGKESTIIDIDMYGNKVGYSLYNVAPAFFFAMDELMLLEDVDLEKSDEDVYSN